MKRLLTITLSIAASICANAENNGWCITATENDIPNYSPALIGNGQIGLVMNRSGLTADKMFDATTVERGRDTHISSIIPTIIPFNFTITANGKNEPAKNWNQTLDMRHGYVTTSFDIPKANVKCTFTALRSMPYATLAHFEFNAEDNVAINIDNSPVIPQSLDNANISDRCFNAGEIDRFINRAEGTFNHGKDAVVSSIAFIRQGKWTINKPQSVSIKLKKGETAEIYAIASTVNTADFSDPWNESERQVLYAISTGTDNLLLRHEEAWNNLWKGDIIIEGNPELQAHARSVIYNIYSSMLPGSRRSIAPMGLTSNHYYGHIFWDADTWILPALAILQPELARSMADYRIDCLPQARKRAAAYGFSGAMYPWESDDLGEESTPTWALTGPLEHHITADVARGAWLSFCATADTTWLRNEAYPMIKDCADYWVSRVTDNADGSCSINSVVGADEYAIGVDDNAFTNGAVIRNLQYACKAAETLGYKPDAEWLRVAKALKFHYINNSDIIAEYRDYDGRQIKQADVALLAFPLDLITDPQIIDKNIKYYESRIDSLNGPAMSHSAMAVNYARMGLPEKASRYIARAYHPNLRGPFHNISETPGNNEVYFATGAGGLLQALIFGYAGLDIDTFEGKGIVSKSGSLPASIKSITIKTPSKSYTVTR